jgi:hypothetical protein
VIYVTIPGMSHTTAKAITLTLLTSLAVMPLAAADDAVPKFKKYTLSEKFYSEGCTYGDFNKDGTLDFAAGPFWYAGPDFQQRHTIYEGKEFDGSKGYSNNFLNFPYDFNADGWTDILVVGFPGQEGAWYENPQGKDVPWPRHVATKIVDNESPPFADITGDGKPELLTHQHGFIGYAEPNWAEPTKEWTFRRISQKPDKRFHKFTHGLGYGDVNGDGRMDVLEARGWWEQPASLTGDAEWAFHPVDFGRGGAQMFTDDVDADGDADVITSLQAHAYGLAWYEQQKDGSGNPTFTQHLILSPDPNVKIKDVQFSQLHAVALHDMDGDGIKDIITGKRRWAHQLSGDPDSMGAPVLYWFRLTRENGKPEFTPILIDDDSGVGTQVTVTDMNGDGKGDVLVGNKRGQFVFIQQPAK